jgi:hypothetical protein
MIVITEGGGLERGDVVRGAPVAGDDGAPGAVADEHEVGLLGPHLDDLVVQPGPDVDDRLLVAALGRRVHRGGDGGVRARAVLGHHEDGRVVVLDEVRWGAGRQQPPVSARCPPREPAGVLRRRMGGVRGHAAAVAGGGVVQHGEGVADRVESGGVVARGDEAGLGEAVGAGVVAGERGGEPRQRVVAGGARDARARQEVERVPEQLRAVLARRRGERGVEVGANANGGGGRGERRESVLHAPCCVVERDAQTVTVRATREHGEEGER